MATRVLLLMALSLSILPLLLLPVATAQFHVKGSVYCDTCRAGFETNVTFYIEGARVGIRCQDRKTMDITFYTEGVTDSTGTYDIVIKNDQYDHICRSVLVSSPLPWCNTPDRGRDTSSIVLTHYENGVVNNLHYANAMGYLKDEPLTQCPGLLKYYLSDIE
ncbi:protein DOWNSTREAM OF FLC-like [Gastrolobium bilobum]|uniref:protein DOWNSTREAM OF FLC-like n=1 Tax=Gastrolobium bilobum TaxID=150636 RepID=UPI002AB09123|nr:protein DOWNSTREAM OF FLC-like [Gastrolobium bilobum]